MLRSRLSNHFSMNMILSYHHKARNFCQTKLDLWPGKFLKNMIITKKTHDLLVSLSPPTKKIREKLTHSKAITLHLPHFPFPTPPGHLESMTSVADIGTTFQTEPSPKAAIHTPRNSFPMDKSQEGGSIHGNPKAFIFRGYFTHLFGVQNLHFSMGFGVPRDGTVPVYFPIHEFRWFLR